MTRSESGGGYRIGNPLRRVAGALIYYVSHLARRDPRLWLFGNLRGFRDNARFLAEHVHDTQPDIEVWWIARTAGEAEAARKAGLRSAHLRTRRAWLLHVRAGVGFLCSSFSDLRMAAMGGAYIVHLYHGVPLKRVLLDVDYVPMMRGPRSLRLLAARISHALMASRLSRVNLIAAPGQLARERFISAFGARPDRVKVLGTPRFDVILGGPAYERVAGGDLRAQLGLPQRAPVVLWLPTWREGSEGWLPPLESNVVDSALAGTDAVLVVKPHPFSNESAFAAWLPEHPQLMLLGQAKIDASCLLRLADTLITDYSSVAFDYSILDRPLFLFVPDAEQYDRADRGLYESLDEYSAGAYFVEWASLLAAVGESLRGSPDAGLALSRRIRARSANNDSPGSCARIVAEVRSAVGIGGATVRPSVGDRQASP